MMVRTFYRVVLPVFLLLVGSSGGFAQLVGDTHSHDNDPGGGNGATLSGGICGYQWANDGKEALALANTQRTNPALYREMAQRAKEGSARVSMLSAGDEYNFFVRQRVAPYTFESVTATLVYDGIKARIWVDNLDLALVSQAKINQLANGLDSATPAASRNPKQGILENDIEVFGETPKVYELSGKTDFFLTDIKDGLSGGAFVAGYFNPYDQTNGAGSNQLNLLYIDSHEGLAAGITNVLGTLAHEFQHLIHNNTFRESDIVYNEGCSEVASILNGYFDRSPADYLNKTNVSLFRWSQGDPGPLILADYARAMTLLYYLRDQFGDPFLTVFNSTQVTGILRIRDAMLGSGNGGGWQGVLRGFAIANYLTAKDTAGLPREYRYGKYLSTARPKPIEKYSDNSFPTSGSMQLDANANAYLEYTNPGGMKATFNSSRNIQVIALLYKGTSPVLSDWQLLPLGEQYSFVANAPYSKIVFVLINSEELPNSSGVSWTFEKVTLGVDDATTTSASAGLAFNEVTPNPAISSSPVTIGFTTPSSGAVTMNVYNTNGEQVRRLLDGVRYDTGAHTLTADFKALPAGVYLVRLVQGEKITTRSIVLTH
jgi:hypothetical protein